MFLPKRIAIIVIAVLNFYNAHAQPGAQVNILTFSVKPVLPADVNSWTTIPAAIILVVQAGSQTNGLVKPVFTIKQGGSRVCGNTVSGATAISISPTHNFTTGEVVG
ncbi:MAG: hypothetical protein LH615_15560, partial [Ferruginibacter sp.]|nr:hypothetical protein [Ferruginibacter sp.]